MCEVDDDMSPISKKSGGKISFNKKRAFNKLCTELEYKDFNSKCHNLYKIVTNILLINNNQLFHQFYRMRIIS